MTARPPPSSTEQPPPATPDGHPHGPAVALVALLSTSAAFALGAVQRRPLGDQPAAMLLLCCLLAFATGAQRLAPSGRLGLAAMAGFPIQAMVDLVLHGGHNLLPFEFAIYAVYGLLGVAAAAIGARIGRQRRR